MNFIVDQVIGDYTYQNNEYKKFTQPKNAGDADLLGVELAYQRDFGFIAPALKCIGFYGTYTYTHTQVNNFNFEGRENEKGPVPAGITRTYSQCFPLLRKERLQRTLLLQLRFELHLTKWEKWQLSTVTMTQ